MTKSVLITGATRGLGKHLARQFAERGYRLALTGRSLESLRQLADELGNQPAQVVVKQLDVSAFDTIASVIGECAIELGGLAMHSCIASSVSREDKVAVHVPF